MFQQEKIHRYPQIWQGGFVGDGQAVDVNYGNNNSGFTEDAVDSTDTEAFTSDTDSESEGFSSGETYASDESDGVKTGDVATTAITGLFLC